MSLKQDFMSIFPTNMDTMGLNPITLKFQKIREEQFWNTNIDKCLGQKRIAIIIGVLIYIMFAIADAIAMPAVKDLAWIIRFALFIPIGLGMFILSYHAMAKKLVHLITSIVMLCSVLGHLFVLWFTPMPVAPLYALSMILFFIYGYALLASDFRIANVVMGTTYLVFLVYLYGFSPIETPERIIITFITLLSLIVSACIAYMIGYIKKRNYYLSINDNVKKTKTDSKKQVETVIKTVESPINKMFDNIMDVVWFINLDGEIKYISHSVKEFLGYEAEDLIGKRAMTIMSIDAYNAFEKHASRLYKDQNLLQDTFEYKTRAGLIKKGEAFVKAYSDKKFGEGYIGSTRPITDEVAKEKETDVKRVHALVTERDGLQSDNALLISEVDDLKNKLLKVNSQMQDKTEMSHSDFISWVGHYNNIYEKQIGGATEEHRKKLKLITERFEAKQMGKSDLYTYLNCARQSLDYISHYLELSQKHMTLFNDIHENNSKFVVKKYKIRTLLEEIVIKLKHLFVDTKHVIEIKCSKSIELSTDRVLFEHLIHDLIIQSITKSFMGIDRGEIIIDVQQDEDQVVILYSDNGKKIVADGFEYAYIQALNINKKTTDIKPLSLLQQALERHYNGTVGIEYDNKINNYKIAIPKNK